MPSLPLVMEFSNGGLRGFKSRHNRLIVAGDDPSSASTESTTSTGKNAIKSKNGHAATKPKKSVSFNTSVKVRKISSHRRYSAEERANMWYTAVESKDIRSAAIATVKKMMKHLPVDDDPNDCSRGLEYKTPKQNKIRQARKMDIIFAVLNEQVSNEGKPNCADLMAEVYISCNRSCTVEAARRGAMDAVEAWGMD